MNRYTVIGYNPKDLVSGLPRQLSVSFDQSWICEADNPDEATKAGGTMTSPFVVVLEHVGGELAVAAHYENHTKFERELVRLF